MAIAGVGSVRGADDRVFVPKYRVVVPLAMVKTGDGLVHHAYQGCLVESLIPEQEWWVEAGIVELINPEPVGAK